MMETVRKRFGLLGRNIVTSQKDILPKNSKLRI
jgi:hypothetical protein